MTQNKAPDGTMRVVVQQAYGEPELVLSVQKLPIPEPGEHEVLVKVHAASMNADIWHAINGIPYLLRLMGNGLFKPKNPVPGIDMAGTVTKTGKHVTLFQPGYKVFGEVMAGHQWQNGGAYAEYVTVDESLLAPMPGNCSFAEAATVPTSGIITLFNLNMSKQFQTGKSVLINGAGGAVGSLAVQLAKAKGMSVTAVDDGAKREHILTLGADHFIDFTQERLDDHGDRYDMIFDVASTILSGGSKRLLTDDGEYIFIGHDHFGTLGRRWLGSVPTAIGYTIAALWDKHLPRPSVAMPPKQEYLYELKELIEAGKVTPAVGQSFPLEEVAEAVRYMESGSPNGRAVIICNTDQ